MRLAILLLCSSMAFGQSTSSAPDTKTQAHSSSGTRTGVSGQLGGNFEILSDTQGVDFGPYLARIVEDVKQNWYHLIRESDERKKGKVAIAFAIMKDGRVQGLGVSASSGDPHLDKPAYGSIAASDPFPALPSEFNGPYLRLRLRFYYNPDKSDLDGSAKEILPEPAPTNEGTPISSTPSNPSKSAVAVNISSLGDSTVPTGESRVMIATVTGAKKKTVKWGISGLGCANSSCGEMVGNLYLAPSAPPNPAEVTLTAVSKADPTAKASVIVHIVEPTSKIASKP